MRTRLLALALSGLALAACQDATPPTGPAPTPEPAATPVPAAGRAIPGKYVVVLKEDAVPSAAAEARRMLGRHGGRLGQVYEHALKGFAADLSGAQAAALAREPTVAFVEPDQVFTVTATQSPVPSWGLDRVDQRSLPLSGGYTYTRTGAGVHFYGIDTGIRGTHADFAGRMGSGYSAVLDLFGTSDCHGHGTHTAATAAGSKYGVAKGAKVYPVRVLDCTGTGTTSGVIAGVDWVTANHVKPAVANMSLGGGASSALDTAVKNSIAKGVVYVFAAGNSNANACNYSPARVTGGLTVGATTKTDARASYSNWGSCLDLFAPGSGIVSAYNSGDNASATMSGTSMAAPHVAGAALLYRQAFPTAGVSTVNAAIVNNATTGKVTSRGTNSPNRLLYTRFFN